MPETHHLIDAQAIGQMKPGAMLINTSRGGLVDTRALIEGLKAGQIGYAGLDVYEEEAGCSSTTSPIACSPTTCSPGC